MWKKFFDFTRLVRGLDYMKKGNVISRNENESEITGVVMGNVPYKVQIKKTNWYNSFVAECTCPYAGQGIPCKHMTAILFDRQREIRAEKIKKYNKGLLVKAKIDEDRAYMDFLIKKNIPLDIDEIYSYKNYIREHISYARMHPDEEIDEFKDSVNEAIKLLISNKQYKVAAFITSEIIYEIARLDRLEKAVFKDLKKSTLAFMAEIEKLNDETINVCIREVMELVA